jgi:hypothetical protein
LPCSKCCKKSVVIDAVREDQVTTSSDDVFHLFFSLLVRSEQVRFASPSKKRTTVTRFYINYNTSPCQLHQAALQINYNTSPCSTADRSTAANQTHRFSKRIRDNYNLTPPFFFLDHFKKRTHRTDTATSYGNFLS